jgi:hypothetical protein
VFSSSSSKILKSILATLSGWSTESSIHFRSASPPFEVQQIQFPGKRLEFLNLPLKNSDSQNGAEFHLRIGPQRRGRPQAFSPGWAPAGQTDGAWAPSQPSITRAFRPGDKSNSGFEVESVSGIACTSEPGPLTASDHPPQNR